LNDRHICVKTENSVPSQMLPPLCIHPFIQSCSHWKVRTLADVGAGRLRSAIPLLRRGFDVCAVETDVQLSRIEDLISDINRRAIGARLTCMSIEEFSSSRLMLDGAISICVLHTIPDTQTRKGILLAIRRNVKAGGHVLVDVPFGEPYYRKKMTKDRSYRDGFLMGRESCMTFYKDYQEEELIEFVEELGFGFEKNYQIRRHHALLFCR